MWSLIISMLFELVSLKGRKKTFCPFFVLQVLQSNVPVLDGHGGADVHLNPQISRKFSVDAVVVGNIAH